MTNLKKVIALALAATSVLSTVASAASFTDTVDNTNETAIDMLSALGIIKGDGDGTFRPEDTVTRAEMAKMIFTIKNGGSDDASDFADLYSELTDISGHWAEGYIKYCETNGIIAGYGGSTNMFKPDAEVTGVEALKMALVALGYKSDKAKLEGESWSQNTLSYAMDVNLTKNVSKYTSSATRANAAQILYNALYADTVVYSDDISDFRTSGNGILATASMQLNETLATITSITEGGFKSSAGSFDSTEDFSEHLYEYVTILHNDDDDVFGLNAESKTKSIEAVNSDISFDDDDVVVKSVKIDDAGNIVNSGETKTVVVVTDASDFVATYNDVSISDFSVVDYLSIVGGYYEHVTSTDDGAGNVTFTTTVKEIEAATDNATLRIVYNGNIADSEAFVAVTEPSIGQVTYTNDDKINVKSLTTANKTLSSYSYEDYAIADDVETDSYVVVTKNAFENVTNVEVLATQTGTVSAIKSGEYRIDGTYYALTTGLAALSNGDEIEFAAIGTTIYGYADVSEDAVADVSDYISVIAVGSSLQGDTGSVDSSTKYWSVKVMSSNGTETSVKVGGIDENGDLTDWGSSAADEVGEDVDAGPELGLYTYVEEDGYVMLTVADKGDFDGFDDTALNYVADDATIGTHDISDDAVFYVATTNAKDSTKVDDVILVTGAEVKAWDDETFTIAQLVLQKFDGFPTVVTGYIQIAGDELPGTTVDTLYGYITADPYEINEDDTDYVVVTVFNGSEDVEYYVEGVLPNDGSADEVTATKGSYIAYTVDDNVITLVALADDSVTIVGSDEETPIYIVAISAYNGTNIAFENGTETTVGESSYKMTDDTQVIYLETADKAGIVGGSISLASDTDGVQADDEKYYADENAVAIVNGENEVVALYVDINSAIADFTAFASIVK